MWWCHMMSSPWTDCSAMSNLLVQCWASLLIFFNASPSSQALSTAPMRSLNSSVCVCVWWRGHAWVDSTYLGHLLMSQGRIWFLGDFWTPWLPSELPCISPHALSPHPSHQDQPFKTTKLMLGVKGRPTVKLRTLNRMLLRMVIRHPNILTSAVFTCWTCISGII